MPKKSEATLAKEATTKLLITKFYGQYVSDKTGEIARPQIRVTFIKGKNLSSNPNYIRRRAKVEPIVAGALTAMRYNLSYPATGKFIFGLSQATLWRYMMIPGMMDYQMWQGTPVTVVKTPYHQDMEQAVQNMVCTNLAAAMTYPDTLGNVVVYMHKDSELARGMKKKKGFDPDEDIAVENGDGLNRDILPTITDWSAVAEYIRHRQGRGAKVDQRAVCDLVKTVSNNIALKQAETKKVRMETVNV